MLAPGCGCPAAPSSSSSSTATALSTLAREPTQQGTLSGQNSVWAVEIDGELVFNAQSTTTVMSGCWGAEANFVTLIIGRS